MARGGFFATLQRQLRQAQREQERREREAARSRAAQARVREKEAKAALRDTAQRLKSEASDKKRRDKEAREAHIAMKEAAVEQRNEELAEIYSDIDSLLESTLSRDDYVDLETLRAKIEHPPFKRPDLTTPVQLPRPIPDPPQPRPSPPEAPSGLARLFGKKRHAEAVVAAEQSHVKALEQWREQCVQAESNRRAAEAEHAVAERSRLEKLEVARARYSEECRAREDAVVAQNASLDELITNLGYGTVEAIQEYIAIVLSNSIYPAHFSPSFEFEFDPDSAELSLRVAAPEPSKFPNTKLYKYAKSSDEIVSTLLGQKDCRDRYSSAVHQIALRSFHEVFEADRRGLIRTISLEVGAKALDPGTGQRGFVPFVIAAAERDSFLKIKLAKVVPAKALERLNASVSKNPYDLVPAPTAGVRSA